PCRDAPAGASVRPACAGTLARTEFQAQLQSVSVGSLPFPSRSPSASTKEPDQPVFPEPLEIGEPLLQFEKGLRPEPVPRFPSLFSGGDQPRPGQDAQMLGNGGAAHGKM